MTLPRPLSPVLAVAVALGVLAAPTGPPSVSTPTVVAPVPVFVTSPAPGREPSTYVVHSGDTLDRIARKLRVPATAIAAANGIVERDLVRLGQRLVIPSSVAEPTRPTSPASYLVRRGDTLDAIARASGVSIDALVSANRLPDRHRVTAGSRLVIPARVAAPGVERYPNLPARLRERPERLAYLPRFEHWARTYGVSPNLLMATTWLESGWQNSLVSSTGARGIGQLMPDTVSFVSGTLIKARLDPRVPDDNIAMSARFLRYLIDQSKGDTRLALCAYYQGLRSVRERGVWPGTAAYASGVLALRSRFESSR